MGSTTSNGRAGGPPHTLADAPWLARPETQAVLGALERQGFESRVVGGAVRNALLGLPVKDVDIATPALPEEVMRIAEAAGLKAIATGIEHGTVTVVANHIPYEVTTLRRDIETFGRHARVVFTNDWGEDASRRDFTINALYCDKHGRIHDPLGTGLGDLAARRVRFIGEPRDRIREDTLRILRFYRFTAEYAGGKLDTAGHAAASELAPGMDGLSRERIRSEMLRLLAAPGAVPVIGAMEQAGVLARILPVLCDTGAHMRLATIESSLGRSPDPILRLAALASGRKGSALALRDGLRLSAREYERIARMDMPDPAFDPGTPEPEARAFIYRHGADAFTDSALVSWARSAASASDGPRRARATLASRWQAPLPPVRGADVIALGVPAGPEVGRILARFEEWWIGTGFTADAVRIAAELQSLVAVTKA